MLRVHIHTCIRIPWDFGHSPLPTLPHRITWLRESFIRECELWPFSDIAYLFRCQVSLIGENATQKFSNFWVSYRFINRKWGISALFFILNSCFTPKYKLTYNLFLWKNSPFFIAFLTSLECSKHLNFRIYK